MIESFVDLTYRGLSLGRRVKLSELRPRSGFLELAAPMPVGTRLTIATDDGIAFDAVVTWVHEPVSGAERAAGMIVAPQLIGDLMELWWRERVALPDEEPRPARNRTTTVRPRARGKPSGPPPEAPPRESAAVVADLAPRVTAAAGVAPRSQPTEQLARASDAYETRAGAMNARDRDRLEQAVRHPIEPGMLPNGEHDVVDDGAKTLIMPSVDSAALGLDAGTSNSGLASVALDTAASGDAASRGEGSDPDGDDASYSRQQDPDADADADGDGDGDADREPDAAASASDARPSNGGDAKPPPRRGWFRRQNKRR